MAAETVLLLALAFLGYTYVGYYGLVRFLSRRVTGGERAHTVLLPSVTVLLACHNEEAVIDRRLENLLECEYPVDNLQILVVLDGCTDRTETKARQWTRDKPVEVLVLPDGPGKTAAQNAAMHRARGEIVVLTDADTIFEKDFFREVVLPFIDSEVGGVTGNLTFRSKNGVLAQGQGWHWRQEMGIRQAESDLGILAVGSGVCLAFRRVLFREMPLDVGDDCIIPLDVVSAGYRFVHQSKAIAYDAQEADPRREFATRVRMTVRNWVGTWSRPHLLNPARFPGYAFALWSHKILRWMSPFFVVAALVSAFLVSVNTGNPWYAWVAAGFLGVGFIGWVGGYMGGRLPIASTVYSFLLVNAAFLVGVLKALSGVRIKAYSAGLSGDRDA